VIEPGPKAGQAGEAGAVETDQAPAKNAGAAPGSETSASRGLDAAHAPSIEFMHLTGLRVVPTGGDGRVVSSRDQFFRLTAEGAEPITAEEAFRIYVKAVADRPGRPSSARVAAPIERSTAARVPGPPTDVRNYKDLPRAERRAARARLREWADTFGLIEQAGTGWKALDLGELLGSMEKDLYLAIGPAGIYTVSVKDQPRDTVAFGSDVIQIRGVRDYDSIPRARAHAELVSRMLGAAVGAGNLRVHGIVAYRKASVLRLGEDPKGVSVVAAQDLAAALGRQGPIMAQRTADKLVMYAANPNIWVE
jgi:hypothetical protein